MAGQSPAVDPAVDNDPALARALRALARTDSDLSRIRKLVGPLPDRSRPADLGSLMRIIVEQQLSVASAGAIWSRLEAMVNPFTAAGVLALDEAALRRAGLSRQKVVYCRNLAAAVEDGALDLDRLDALDDKDALAALTAVKGIGRWSAEIFLLFALRRPDIWPAHDLALQVAVMTAKGLPARPTWRDMDRLAEPWRPHRGAAARLLWRYYRVTRDRPDPGALDRGRRAG